jgi:hypothetical protein
MTDSAMLLAHAAEQAESADLRYAGIFSPDFGERRDIPSIILPEAFTAENVNVLLRDGEIERIKMRLPELLETNYTDATGTLTIANGEHHFYVDAGAGTWGTSADHKPNWTGRVITVTDDGTDTDYIISSVADDGASVATTTNYTGTGGAGLAYTIGTAGTKVKTPDTYAIIHYESLVIYAGGVEIEYLLAYTKAHVYLWNVTWSAWILKFTCGSNCSRWESVCVNGKVISTNFVDKVQVWGSTIANAFGNLGGASGIDIGGGQYIEAAKYICSYEGYIILGYLKVSGSVYGDRMDWCTNYDETDWDQTGTGDAGSRYDRIEGYITGFGKWSGHLILAKQKAMRYGWVVTNSDVFNFDTMCEKTGCKSAGSMINDGEGRFYWLDDSYHIRRLPGAEVVSGPKDATLRLINPSLQENICSCYLREYGLLLWSVPCGVEATGNDKIVAMGLPRGTWGEIDVAVAAFGIYSRQTVYDWATLPFDSWDEWGWDDWSGPENVVGFALDLVSDYSGYTFDLHAAEMDNKESYTGHFVLSTDLLMQVMAKRHGIGLRTFKRIEEMLLFFRKEAESDTAAVHAKCDGETSWSSVGTVSLHGTKDDVSVSLPCDLRARHFLIKISATNRFRFLGVIFGFIPDGKR